MPVVLDPYQGLSGKDRLIVNAKFGFNYINWINGLIAKKTPQNKIDEILNKLPKPLFDLWIDKNIVSAYIKNGMDFNIMPFDTNIKTINDVDLNAFNILDAPPKQLLGKLLFEYIPLIYEFTKNKNLIEVNNYFTRAYNSLNEYYYIEQDGTLRGEKYKKNLPLDNVGFIFPEPFIWKVSEVVNIGIPSIPKTSTPKTAIPKGPKTPGRPQAPKTPLSATNKNFILIGGLIIGYLILKK